MTALLRILGGLIATLLVAGFVGHEVEKNTKEKAATPTPTVTTAFMPTPSHASPSLRPSTPTPTPTRKTYAPFETRTLTVGGQTRSYLLHVPNNTAPTSATPLVLAFHGGGSNAEAAEAFFHLQATADAHRFLLVYPEGTGPLFQGKRVGTWNAGRCCGNAMQNNVDDVGFTRALLEDVQKEFPVDSKRIYATGHSNGALMDYRLACELSNTIAAIAPSGGQDAESSCTPSRPMPILHFHGTADPCALFTGGACGGCFQKFLQTIGIPVGGGQHWQCAPVNDYVNTWRVRNGCSAASTTVYNQGGAHCTAFQGCSQNATVEMCTVDRMGHLWPGGGWGNPACTADENSTACKLWKGTVGPLGNSADLNANEALWNFFQQHPLP